MEKKGKGSVNDQLLRRMIKKRGINANNDDDGQIANEFRIWHDIIPWI